MLKTTTSKTITKTKKTFQHTTLRKKKLKDDYKKRYNFSAHNGDALDNQLHMGAAAVAV